MMSLSYADYLRPFFSSYCSCSQDLFGGLFSQKPLAMICWFGDVLLRRLAPRYPSGIWCPRSAALALMCGAARWHVWYHASGSLPNQVPRLRSVLQAFLSSLITPSFLVKTCLIVPPILNHPLKLRNDLDFFVPAGRKPEKLTSYNECDCFPFTFSVLGDSPVLSYPHRFFYLPFVPLDLRRSSGFTSWGPMQGRSPRASASRCGWGPRSPTSTSL